MLARRDASLSRVISWSWKSEFMCVCTVSDGTELHTETGRSSAFTACLTLNSLLSFVFSASLSQECPSDSPPPTQLRRRLAVAQGPVAVRCVQFSGTAWGGAHCPCPSCIEFKQPRDLGGLEPQGRAGFRLRPALVPSVWEEWVQSPASQPGLPSALQACGVAVSAFSSHEGLAGRLLGGSV